MKRNNNKNQEEWKFTMMILKHDLMTNNAIKKGKNNEENRGRKPKKKNTEKYLNFYCSLLFVLLATDTVASIHFPKWWQYWAKLSDLLVRLLHGVNLSSRFSSILSILFVILFFYFVSLFTLHFSLIYALENIKNLHNNTYTWTTIYNVWQQNNIQSQDIFINFYIKSSTTN